MPACAKCRICDAAATYLSMNDPHLLFENTSTLLVLIQNIGLIQAILLCWVIAFASLPPLFESNEKDRRAAGYVSRCVNMKRFSSQ